MSILYGTVFEDDSTINVVDIFGDGSGVELFQFNGNLQGSSGVYNGSGTNVTYTAGKFGQQCVVVSGGKIDLGAGSKILMPHNGDYSISTWIYNSGVRSRRVIAGRMNSTLPYGDNLGYEADNTIVFGKAYTNVGGSMETLVYTPSFSIGWHHVALSFDRVANIANIHCDNTLVATKNNWNTGSFDNNLNTLIGAYHNVNYNAYQQQTRFFNKAVNTSEVSQLYMEVA